MFWYSGGFLLVVIVFVVIPESIGCVISEVMLKTEAFYFFDPVYQQEHVFEPSLLMNLIDGLEYAFGTVIMPDEKDVAMGLFTNDHCFRYHSKGRTVKNDEIKTAGEVVQ